MMAIGRRGGRMAVSSTNPHPAATRLRAHVAMLAGTIGERHVWRYEALNRAADYIARELGASGSPPARQTFEVAKMPISNIVATVTGATRRDEIVVVGGHYDTVAGCPGANANPTAFGAGWGLARRSCRRPPARTFRFSAFVNGHPRCFQTPH